MKSHLPMQTFLSHSPQSTSDTPDGQPALDSQLIQALMGMHPCPPPHEKQAAHGSWDDAFTYICITMSSAPSTEKPSLDQPNFSLTLCPRGPASPIPQRSFHLATEALGLWHPHGGNLHFIPIRLLNAKDSLDFEGVAFQSKAAFHIH